MLAIKCSTWPRIANEWITRKRSPSWESKQAGLVQEVVQGGCHFVLKPTQDALEEEKLWRYSFSGAEIILIHAWTPVQKYVYHVLRKVRNDIKRRFEKKKVLTT